MSTPTYNDLADQLRRLMVLAQKTRSSAGQARHMEEFEYRLGQLVSIAQARPAPVPDEQAGEHVAYVNDDGFIVEKDLSLAPGMKLYARPAAAEKREQLTDEQLNVLKFLYGTGALRDCGFGTLPIGEAAKFWWRTELACAFPEVRAHGIGTQTSTGGEA